MHIFYSNIGTLTQGVSTLKSRYIVYYTKGSITCNSSTGYSTTDVTMNVSSTGTNSLLMFISFSLYIGFRSTSLPTCGIGFSDSSGSVNSSGIASAKLGAYFSGGPTYKIDNRIDCIPPTSSGDTTGSGTWSGSFSGNKLRILMFCGGASSITVDYFPIIFAL